MAFECKSIKRLLFWFAFLIFVPSLVSCKQRSIHQDSAVCPHSLESICLKRSVFIELVTNRGTITLFIDGNLAPATAGNFVDLVKRGIYDGTIFHRVIRTPMPFVVQGGDPFSKTTDVSKKQTWTGSYLDEASGQARLIPLEIKLKNESVPRYNSLVINPNELAELELIHEKGSLAMARSEPLDSASSQFYFALRRLPELDGRYAVFGKVVKGIEILDRVEQFDKILKAKILEEASNN